MLGYDVDPEYIVAPAPPIGPLVETGPPYVDGGPPIPPGAQLPPPFVQFLLQPIAADSRMAPCSHQKRLDFLIFDILSV
jgi:hypothetical protein